MRTNVNNKTENWYSSIYGWILFIVINASGNLFVSTLLPNQLIIVLLFIFLLFTVLKNKLLNINHLLVIYTWFLLLLIPYFYLQSFSVPSTLHIFLKICIGIFTVLYCKDHLCKHYVDIMFFLAIISLLCFAYNCFIGVIPYIPVESTTIDGGNIFRVSSILYTQLYNGAAMELTLRNCGPFWEPGAFQGFINLALFINIFYCSNNNKYWLLKNIVFIVTVLTTLSTGGYIVLFIISALIVLYKTHWLQFTKMIVIFIIVLMAIYLYYSLEFLGDKISTDSSRTDISVDDIFVDNLYMVLFGFGYETNSFKTSSIKTAAALINLIRYSGFLGFLLYLCPLLFGIKNQISIWFTIVLLLILFNEPFLTAGPFWWGVPLFLFYLRPSTPK